MRQDIMHLLDRDVVVSSRLNPELSRSLNAYRHRGKLTTVLPGIYTTPERVEELETRIAAAAVAPFDVVLMGRVAAHSTWWPELEVDVVDVATSSMVGERSGYRFHQRFIPPELIHRGETIAVTSPALTVLDLIPDLGPDCIDEALRRRAVTLGHLQAALALTPHRRGNAERRRLLADSRDQPWSALERRAHRLLRQMRIGGWRTNHPVVVDGATYYLDIAFPELRVAIEIDGFEFHGNRTAFHSDRTRDAKLTAAGWHVIRLSSENLAALPDVLRSLVARRGSR